MPARNRSLRRSKSSSSGGVRVLDELQQLGSAAAAAALVPELTALASTELEELRRLRRPPEVVQRMLEVVHLVLQLGANPQTKPREPDWADVLRTLASDKLLKTMQQFDISVLQGNVEFAQYLCQHYLSPPESGAEALTLERVRHANRAAVALFAWSAGVLEEANLDVPALLPKSACKGKEKKPAKSKRLRDAYLWGTCPGAHGLTKLESRHASACDVCGRSTQGQDAGTPSAEQDEASSSIADQFWGCHLCSFSLCPSCRRGAGFRAQLEHQGDPEQLAIELHWLKKGEVLPAKVDLGQLGDRDEGGLFAWWPRAGCPSELQAAAPTLGIEIGDFRHSVLIDETVMVKPGSGTDVKRSSKKRSEERVPVLGIFCWAGAAWVAQQRENAAFVDCEFGRSHASTPTAALTS